MTIRSNFAGTSRFEVCGQLGQGATGMVYRVRDREVGREVALKTLRLPGAEALYRLKREFRTRAGIVHPNLLQLHELFVDDGIPFFTMEMVEGVDFLSWARRELALGGGIPQTWESSLASGASTLQASEGGEGRIPVEEPASATPARSGAWPAVASREESWPRLREGLMQLLRGLGALHAAGLVHRDVKPSNVLVTGEERVLLLDFGLMTERQQPSRGGAPAQRRAGTPAYMAPEQVTGESVTPAADLYAVGAMLYQVLTGAFPFAVEPERLLELKVSQEPPPVHAQAPDAPGDLAALAQELLALDPKQRPSAEECIARLSPVLAGAAPQRLVMASASHAPFVGRARELDVLDAALAEVSQQQRQITVHVHGPSGMGKSTLVREFLAQRAPAPAPMVLQGRCHPQESVPYKAMDAAIDSLARQLGALAVDEAAALVPAQAYALTRLFPVLGRLAVFQHATVPAVLPEPAELRHQGFQALRELLERLGRARPLVLWVDDVQWGDADSAPLFQELLRSPAPRMLLVLSWRTEDRSRSPLLRRLLELAPPEALSGAARELPLGAMGEQEVAALVASMLGARTSGSDSQVEAVISHAEGNPFIACELARHVGAHAGQGLPLPAQVDVAQLLMERIRSLSPEQRALLEVAAVAGRPLGRSVALRAAGLDEGGRAVSAWLRDSSLLREVPAEGEVDIAAYHDRIREALLEALPAHVRVGRHRGIAEALSARGSEDFEALLVHWEGAGEPMRAGEYAVRSAERASQTLAFGRSAELYQRGLELLGESADRPSLLEKLAQALANQGRAPEAAQRYLESAEALGTGLQGTRVSGLKQRAAEQYLKSGRFNLGWREMRSVLETLGIPVPGSFLGAMGSAMWRRVVFLARRVDVDAARPALAPEERHRLEVLWATSTSWSMVNPTLADAFRMMHLLRALEAGDTSTLCRALGFEAAMESHVGGRFLENNARKLLEKVRVLMERTGDPYDQAWYFMSVANQAYTLGRWREAAEACDRADVLFREQCPGTAWERVSVAIFHHHALAMLGELPALAARLEALDRDATLRGDVHARCEAWIGEPVLAWLAKDRAEEAQARAADALAAQSPVASTWPENAYRRQQYAELIACVYASHYRGDPWPAWKAVLEHWAPLKSSFMLSLRATGLGLRHMRARAALAAAESLPDERTSPPDRVDPRWNRRALLADVRAQLRVMEGDPIGSARPLGHLLRAGLARLSGDTATAVRELEQAVAGLEREGVALYREAARYALGTLQGGSEGEALRHQASEWMAARQVVRPGALAAAMVPGLGLPPGPRTPQDVGGR
ncbi:serine/threonine-protein kinase PknK [Corallococcus coralloides]|uniref:serine/threonine-protein kinase n=1 Tax=Corallococcus coralloides TaxID=184914 RepID=UPI0005B82FD3|nr:serine/threonine-protein kinase [Corallococcus coralloides]